ncbi:MAG: sigma-54 dependent transcriptional regulator [Dysgonamonadaceae bacterium]|jgi:transcriptional regulator with PAS, ATPase and Fis domain|nr:sigma-54 dependent transcriptional regulator [Dysgonamonadaceae bacterium]
MNVQAIKQRFDIIGNAPELNRALDIARQVAPTDLSVLITGESGAGKEVFSQIIHQYSSRKHGSYIAVNCGAIPEGTIDSELFGHEKGSFTGAHDTRKGYFEEANKGTIFLDEVAELPLTTQVRLLRVLESGEFLKVGSSKVQKTDVRVVAATNVNVMQAVQSGRFREDLYYRLNTVPIHVPALRERKEDIYLLFRKFAADFAERYRMPAVALASEAQQVLLAYYWPGNVRQLKNVVEQLSVIENSRTISAEVLRRYLPEQEITQLPILYQGKSAATDFASEREILYKILFDMRQDINDLKRVMHGAITHTAPAVQGMTVVPDNYIIPAQEGYASQEKIVPEEIEETLSIQEKEEALIRKALERHNGKRKYAAQDLGISERTLYRKIKEYGLED